MEIKKKKNILDEKNKIFNLYKLKNKFNQKISYDNFYHNFMLHFLKVFEGKKLDEFDDYCNYFLKIKKSKVEISETVKIAALSRFQNSDLSKKIIEKISEDSFEKLYLKFALYENLDNEKRENLISKLEKLKSNQFFDQLKFLYCCFKLNKNNYVDKEIKRAKTKINSKLFAIYFLKLIFVAGKFEIFKNNLKILTKKFKITNDEKIDILLSTCFVEPKTIAAFKMIFKNEKISESKKLNKTVLDLKLGKISEKIFMQKIVKNYMNYYSIGFALKNTIKHLSIKNIRFLSAKSLKFKSTRQNINFISEIFFYNQMYKDCLKTTSKIKNLSKYSIFYDLKRSLSKVSIKNKLIENNIINFSKKDFFRVVHNGRVVILPFMCNGNNQVRISGN